MTPRKSTVPEVSTSEAATAEPAASPTDAQGADGTDHPKRQSRKPKATTTSKTAASTSTAAASTASKPPRETPDGPKAPAKKVPVKKAPTRAKKSTRTGPAAKSAAGPRDPRPSRAAVKGAVADVAEAPRKNKTFYLSEDVLARLAATVFWARSRALEVAERGDAVDWEDVPEKMSSTVERAVWAEVLYVEQRYNDGKPFPAAPGELMTGPGAGGRERISKARRGEIPARRTSSS